MPRHSGLNWYWPFSKHRLDYPKRTCLNLSTPDKTTLYRLWAAVAVLALAGIWFGQGMTKEAVESYNELSPEEERVILHKGTETPFTGEYYKHSEKGTYICRQCNAPLYRSNDKFDSGCGWPSFDDEIPGAVTHTRDPDGMRVEITCAHCGGHLGHVFEGERFTQKNVRHCVNSISLGFVPAPSATATQKAYFAGGCFWGTEHLLQQHKGVLSVRSGYMGGRKKNPTYKDVCTGQSGHAETVEVEFDSSQTTFEALARYFLEIHDPTEVDRQGPDMGTQYRSAVFYTTDEQKQVAQKLIAILKSKGYEVVTQVEPADTFYVAEGYHQDYYEHSGKTPYCHFWQKRF